MLASEQPRWRRRKEDRPGEIVAAALEVFAEKGFAAARLDDIAARYSIDVEESLVKHPFRLQPCRAC